VRDYGSWWLAEYGRVVVDLLPLHRTSLETASRELLRVFAIVLSDAEDVAPRSNRGKKLDAVQRDFWSIECTRLTATTVPVDQIDHIVQLGIKSAYRRQIDVD